MRIFAIQKTQTNTYAPRFTQDNSVSQNPIQKTNLPQDKFESKVAFGAIIRSEILGKSVEELRENLPKLAQRFKAGLIPEKDYHDTVSATESQITDLIEFAQRDCAGEPTPADMRLGDKD